MKSSAPVPSARLLRAAAAERSELERHRRALLDKHDRLRSELVEIQAALADTDERLVLIERIVGSAPAAPRSGSGQGVGRSGSGEGRSGSGVGRSGSGESRSGSGEGVGRSPSDPAGVEVPRQLATATALRGPQIRRTAVALALRRPDAPEALHYRKWFGLLREAGYDVAGKNPLAVFLTQLGRSPLVRRGTQPGVYELDLGAPRRLRQRLEELQAQLRALTALPPTPATDIAAIRARRTALALELGKVEKALQEAEQTLRGAADDGCRSLAAAR